MSYRGIISGKIKIIYALTVVIAATAFCSGFAFAQRVPVRRKTVSPRVGTIVSGGSTTNVKSAIDKYYPNFKRCLLLDCGGDYASCYDSNSKEAQTKFDTAKKTCFDGSFGKYITDEKSLEEIKVQALLNLSLEIKSLCIEENERQVFGATGCSALPLNSSPGYRRYKNCVQSSCISMDGGSGNFAGCFGTSQSSNLVTATDTCNNMLETYSVSNAQRIRDELLKEIAKNEKNACNDMMGDYSNTTIADGNVNPTLPGGSCEVYVGYTRANSLTRKYSFGKEKDFYAIKADGDFYKTNPSTFTVYPANSKMGDDKYFGRYEKAIKYKIGSDVFCSNSTFDLPQLFSYDSAADDQYGSFINGGSAASPASIQLIMGGFMGGAAVLPALINKKEGTEKLSGHVGAISQVTDTLKGLAPTVSGSIMLQGDKGREMRVGDEIKGRCILQGGGEVKEGDTITIRW